MFNILAENVAKECQISREQQDDYALQSQRRVEEAQKAGHFLTEVVPVIVKDRKGNLTVDRDEFPRADTSLESLAKLRPAFTPVRNLISNTSFPSTLLNTFFFLFRTVQLLQGTLLA